MGLCVGLDRLLGHVWGEDIAHHQAQQLALKREVGRLRGRRDAADEVVKELSPAVAIQEGLDVHLPIRVRVRVRVRVRDTEGSRCAPSGAGVG